MLAALYRKRKQLANKKGMTMTEVIISLAIIAIILTFIVINVARMLLQAYMTRANDTAEVVYMALQTSITDLKVQGRFDETFAESKRGVEGQYHTVPDIAIDGLEWNGYTIPGITNSEGIWWSDSTNPEEQARLEKLKENGDLVYMKLSIDDNEEDSDLLRELIAPYITDSTILEQSILAEVNLENKTVRAVFYTERADKLCYGKDSTDNYVIAATLTEDILKSNENVLLRERTELRDKRQGYHGSLGVGEPENIGLLENAYIRVNNDDMLTIEWGEIGPTDGIGGITAEARALFAGMSYDLKIVNAHDTNQIYYEIKDIRAYGANESYLSDTAIQSGTPDKTRLPMPFYDLYGYTHVNHALDPANKVPFTTIEYVLQDDGTREPEVHTDFEHRLSYYVPKNDSDGTRNYGVFRLVLDSITDIGDEELSISEVYPEIPWNENFKVIVEGKYRGEGFTGSLSISEGDENGYVAEKAINPEEDMYFAGSRGAGLLEELATFILNRDDTNVRSNMWYELAYARHLNNMRYIVEYEDPATPPEGYEAKNGYKQNFLLIDDIDWSIQQLGRTGTTNEDDEEIHRLVVSNAKGNDLTVTDTEELRAFQTISAEIGEAADAFEGKIVSQIQRDDDGEKMYMLASDGTPRMFTDGVESLPMPLYNTFNIAYLKLENDNGTNEHVGLFDYIGQDGYIRDFNIHGVTAVGQDYVGAIAGRFEGFAKNITLIRNETVNPHKTINNVGDEVAVSGKEIRPFNYPAASPFTGNTITAEGDYAGGIAGELSRGNTATLPPDNLSGTVIDIANGNRLVDIYAGTINESDQTPQPSSSANESIDKLQGIAVNAQNYTGGLFGTADEDTIITKVVNTGTVVSTQNYAGGIVGELNQSAKISGLDTDALVAGEEYLTREYAYGTAGNTKDFIADNTNYGAIRAVEYAGGVVGVIAGNDAELQHLGNVGPIHATNQRAGGIVAGITSNNVSLIDMRNKADVVSNGNYAGGILGETVGSATNIVIQGATNQRTQSRVAFAGLPSGTGTGITGSSYVGGIVGAGRMNLAIEQYEMPYALGTHAIGAVVKLTNEGAITAREEYAGGFAGALIDNATLNTDTKGLNLVASARAIRNSANIRARNYAGGAIGAAADHVEARNIENITGGTVVTTQSYAGGIIGAINSQAEMGIGSSTIRNVKFSNDVAIAAGRQNYYTNNATVTATQHNAGGIIGYANTDAVRTVENVFNGAQVHAEQNNAGGIFGNVDGTTVLTYDLALLEERLTVGTGILATIVPTNRGYIQANVNAGGIAGIINSNDVVLHNTFNGGQIQAINSNAGGIAGRIEQRRTTGNILEYDSHIINNVVVPTNTAHRPLYTNTGQITSSSHNAGGIVGSSKTSLRNVFNSGAVQTHNANGGSAGGIVGEFVGENDATRLTVEMDGAVAERVIHRARTAGLSEIYSNNGSVTTGTVTGNNAGGIAGYTAYTNILNQFNRGNIRANGNNAGGLVGNANHTSISLQQNIAQESAQEGVVTNLATVQTGRTNAGGIAGYAGNTTVTDVFNRGATTAGTDNAGGIVGHAHSSTAIEHRTAIVNTYVLDANTYFMTNQASVTANGLNAGGIAGKTDGGVILRDVYSGVTATDGITIRGGSNAGGMVGRLLDTEITNAASVRTAIEKGIYTNNTRVIATNSNAGGIVGNADANGSADNRYATMNANTMNSQISANYTNNNNFVISDVYNKGTVSTATHNNAGGIFGVAGYGEYINTPARVVELVEQGMSTNAGAITARQNNAGGIFGFANAKFDSTGSDHEVTDIFNAGAIKAEGNNAGGIAGKAIDLELNYTDRVLKDAMNAESGDPDDFLFSNSNSVNAVMNAGGIVGDANNVILQNAFNSGIGKTETQSSYDRAMNDTTNRIVASNDNAGGLVGRAKGLNISYSQVIEEQILGNIEYVYTNIANVNARNNAGGIIGHANGSVQILDAYNRGRVETVNHAAGGIAGRLDETGTGMIAVEDSTDPLSAIDIAATKGRSVSYITYRTITTDTSYTTNRYSNMPKPATIANGNDQVRAGTGSNTGNNAGGIVGHLNSSRTQPNNRIENVFNAGATDSDGNQIAGIRARGSNAGGLIGHSQNGHISYSFAINPSADNLDTSAKGEYSTFVEAFNAEEVRKNPYAIDTNGFLPGGYVGLHMVANNAVVRASSVNAGVAQSQGQLPVNFDSGSQQNMTNQNAGGAIGYMQGGRIERVYSLQGEVVAPRNVGGVVGLASRNGTANAIIKQVSRMDGEDIRLGTTLVLDGAGNPTANVLARGSENVGGIVGHATAGTEVLDTRNYTLVEGRTAVGGIIGLADDNVKVTLAQNIQAVSGVALSAEQLQSEAGLSELPSYDDYRLDKSSVDGSYIGGIVGRADSNNSRTTTAVTVTMVKNDPLITDEFHELALDDEEKYERGGNEQTRISGKTNVGGVIGAGGTVNYAINTGKVTGVQNVGGISGSGHKIVNAFNTADVVGENGHIYVRETPIPMQPIIEWKQAVHIGGIAGELGVRLSGNSIVQDYNGAFAQNVYNAGQFVRGASFTGGIAGYAIGPIDVAYNSAQVSVRQARQEEHDASADALGVRVGGIVGVLGNDRDSVVRVTNSYNVGEIVGTSDRGTLIGTIDGAMSELIETERIKNSYYLSDEEMFSWNSLSGQIDVQINHGITPLTVGLEPRTFTEYVAITDAISDTSKTLVDSSYSGEILTDSNYGLRNYYNMVLDVLQPHPPGSVAFTPRGDSNLQEPLNAGINQMLTASGLTAEPPATRRVTDVQADITQQRRYAGRFVFPNEDGETAIGRDYEFPQLDFAGSSANEQGIQEIPLGSYSSELLGNNQVFVSLDNAKVSHYHMYWPTSVIDYMKADVQYDDGGSDDTSVYNDGELVSNNTEPADITFRENDKYPIRRETDEKVTLVAEFAEHTEKPSFIYFNVYDGHSRGVYHPENTQFHNIILPRAPMKSYILARQDVFTTQGLQIPDIAESVSINGTPYYLYSNDTAVLEDGSNSIEHIHFSEGVAADPSDLQIKLEIESKEMQSYMAATSGYFTLEVTKIYDEESSISKANLNAQERTSRMFSMHFSNTNIDETHNNSVLDHNPTINFDDLDNLDYDTHGTASLGSTFLEETSPGVFAANENKLQIRNERHLYNINQNDVMGYGGIGSSHLPYLAREMELMTDIQLSAEQSTIDSRVSHNGFVIGASNQRLYRMTGSLDGNGYTIGNLQVDRNTNQGNFLQGSMGAEEYALIYELSGGVVKDLYIGDDSKIVAQSAAGLAFMVSNGRSPTSANPYDDLDNLMFENVGLHIPAEAGTDAKIYDTTVLADINAQNVGGVSYTTGRRFNSSYSVPSSPLAESQGTLAATFTNVAFGGKINAIYPSAEEPTWIATGNAHARGSEKAAGILTFVDGRVLQDDIDYANPGTNTIFNNYKTNVAINGSQVSSDGYVFANQVASGILGEATSPMVSNGQVRQNAIIQKSANNGTVVSNQQANGITQGTQANMAALCTSKQSVPCRTHSHVEVIHSYNNGVVQTPDSTGLASGIGSYVSKISYSANNGSVIGKIASGISNYGDNHADIEFVANNGYVQGSQIAGGIVATSARFSSSMAVPHQDVQVKVSNAYNTGQVVVTTNYDNKKALENSYAGGIVGYASSPRPDSYSWRSLKPSDIEDEDRTIVTDSYNIGMVGYVDLATSSCTLTNMTFSNNNRNIGGIVGGGLNRYVNITNAYNLSDSELREMTIEPRRLQLSEDPSTGVTDFTKYPITVNPAARGYNYELTAVGDTTYGENVTNMGYLDMMKKSNFVGFDPAIWKYDHVTLDEDGEILYPFPQFQMQETQEAYVGDEHIADTGDFAFNEAINNAKFGVAISTPAQTMDSADVWEQEVVANEIQYAANFANPVADAQYSQYSIHIPSYTVGERYQVTVYDGDAYAQDYAPAIIRQYQIDENGVVTSGGKRHNYRVSTTEVPMNYVSSFGPNDSAEWKPHIKTLTILDAESAAWHMPQQGYYTVVVTKPSLTPVNTSLYAQFLALILGDGTVQGNQKTAIRSNVSERFQVHFGGEETDGSNIQAQNTLIWSNADYKYGTKDNPYHVTDQHSIIGLTTAGIVQNATHERYYEQVRNFEITQPFYAMFEFNGDYDGGGHTITQRNDDVGFISYLRSIDPNAMSGNPNDFAARVHNLTLDVEAKESGWVDRLGKFQEAVNYTANIGLIADYVDSAYITKVTTAGNVQAGGFDDLADVDYYLASAQGDAHTLAGIAAFTREAKLTGVKNTAQLGVSTTEGMLTIPLGDEDELHVDYEEHLTALREGKNVEIAGVTALAKNTEFEHISNNGMLVAQRRGNAAGLVHTLNEMSSIRQSMNGGRIRARDGTAAGLVLNMDSGVVEQAYNSGKITAAHLTEMSGNGTAVGGIANLEGGAVLELYNAGMIVGKHQGALLRDKGQAGRMQNSYYFKDDKYYWGDSHALPDLPDSMIVTDEEDIELFMGFGKVPTEIWAFTNVDHSTYYTPPVIVGGTIVTPESYNDPLAVTFAELTDTVEMTLKGFDMRPDNASGAWIVDPEPANTTIEANVLLRDYGKDPYPLPKFVDNDHGIRENLNFPLFFGEAEETARAPYADDDSNVRYEPYDIIGNAGETQIFKDTIKIDLNSMRSTSQYDILIYDGDIPLADLEDKDHAKAVIQIVRKYIDLRIPGAGTIINNPANMQYSKVFVTDDGDAYYYEILEVGGYPNERPAIFVDKDFVDGKNEILINNNLLDRLREPQNESEPYYSATVIAYQIPGQDVTDPDNFFSKFSPHFANAVATQDEAWQYGTEATPYEIATQRNLNNIGLGGLPSKPGDPIPLSSHYLSAHYAQSQDIVLTIAKPVVNASLEGPEVSQERFWQRSIGTDSLRFSGSYTAKSSDTLDLDGRYPMYQIVDRRFIQGANPQPSYPGIFGEIAEDAVISDINLRLATSTGGAAASQVRRYDKAILVENSRGTVQNITVSKEPATIIVERNTAATPNSAFGLVIGETTANEATASTPLVSQITIEPGITLRSTGSNVTAMGTVIGQANDSITMNEIKSSAHIQDSQNGRIPAVGGVIGRVFGTAGESTELNFDDITYGGDIIAPQASGVAKNVGGIIGELRNIETVALSNVTVGVQGRVLINVGSGNANLIVGGVIGNAVGELGAEPISTMKMQNINSIGNIHVNRTGGTTTTVGNVLGNSENYDLLLQNILANGSTNVGVGTSTGATYIGGIIGQVKEAQKVELEEVVAAAVNGTAISASRTGTSQYRTGGVIGELRNIATVVLNDITTGVQGRDLMNVNGNNGNASLIAGGVIGNAVGEVGAEPISTIEMRNVHNNGNVRVTGSGTSSDTIVGNILGNSENYDLSLQNITAGGSITVTTGSTLGATYTGGIIGQAKDAQDILLEDVVAGIAGRGDTINVTSNGRSKHRTGGAIGFINNTAHVGTATTKLDNVISNHGINQVHSGTTTNLVAENVMGGVIGQSTGTDIDLINVESRGNLKTNAIASATPVYTGGIIGFTEEAKSIEMRKVITGVFDEGENKPLTSITVNGRNATTNFVTGGIIGNAKAQTNAGSTLYMYEVQNNSNLILLNTSNNNVVGGIIGEQEHYETSMIEVENRGNIKITELGDESSIYAGGFIGRVSDSLVMLENTSDTSDSNIVNHGNIEIEIEVEVQRPTAPANNFNAGTAYISGGIAFANDSEIEINGFKNAGNVDVQGENQDMNLYIGGILATAVSGIDTLPEQAVRISNTLNDGNLQDNREVLTQEEQEDSERNRGVSLIGGLVGVTDVATGTKIGYSHNTGALRATSATGIIHTVKNDDNVSKSDIKHNINVGLIDAAAYELADNISMTRALPIGTDEDGIEYDGYGVEIGTIPDPDEELETPVITTYYNLALEDTIRPEEEIVEEEAEEDDSEEESEELATETRLDGLTLSLAQLQDYDSVIELSGWDNTQIDLAATEHSTAPWIMYTEEDADDPDEVLYLLPTIRHNETKSDENREHLARAVEFVSAQAAGTNYDIRWTHDPEFEAGEHGFAIIIENAQGEVEKIFELEPGAALYDGDNGYSIELDRGYFASITNELDADTEFTIRIGSMHMDSEGRRMTGFAGTIELRATNGIPMRGGADRIVGIENTMGGFSLMGFGYSSGIGNAVVAYATTRLGDPYSMPLAGQGAYLDCSYLVLQAYRSVGINLPRTAAEQARYMVDNGYTISKAELQPGDLIFYSWAPNGRFKNIGHVSIYIGNNQVIEASSVQGKVVIAPLSADSSQVVYGRPYVASGEVMNLATQGNRGISAEVEAYRSMVTRFAHEYGIAEYVPHLLAIMQAESGGRGNDPMQSSESLGLAVNTLQPEQSVRQGVAYFAQVLSSSAAAGTDLNTAIQAYNYGGGFINYVAARGQRYTFELAQSFSAERAGGATIGYSNPIAVARNGGYRYRYGNMFYVDVINQYLQ